MYKAEYYDFSGNEGKRIKEDLKNWGFHHLTISRLPADFFRMSKSQLEKLFEHASDAFIARMYDVPEQQIQNRRDDFGIKQLTNTLNRMEREDEAAQIFKEILRIVSNEYNNGNIPHTNSTPLNSEKEFLYMKATGIVRRIDDLGRVVIPKEIRRTMRIREGDPLEIYTDIDGEVIFKKYSPMGELAEFTSQYCEVLFKAISMPVLITDRDHVVCSMGVTKKDAVDKRITPQLEKIMENRSTYIATSFERNVLTPIEGLDKNACIAVPIIGNGDISGCVIVLFNDKGELPTNAEIKLAEVASQFLGKQTEE